MGEKNLISRLGGNLVFVFASCSDKIGVPLELQRGPHGTFHIASGKSVLFQSYKGHLRIPLKSLQGNRASSPFEAENCGLLSSWDRYLGVHIEFQQGSQA